MKKQCLYAVATLMVMVVAPAFAQEEMKEGMPENPEFTVIITEKVKPGMTMDYEEGTKKLMETLKGMNAPFPVWGWEESNGSYNYGVPIASMGTLDQYAGVWAQAVAELRKSEWGEKRQAAILSTKYTIWVSSAHLSYMPEGYDESAMAEMMYSHVWSFRVSHKDETGFNQAMMKMSAWFKEIGYDRPYFVYRNIIGEEGPIYVLVTAAKDPADNWNHMNSMLMEKHGEAFQAMKEEIGKFLTHVSEEFGWNRLDLSLIPEM